MEKVIILKRTNKGKKDEIQLRFRLRDGRSVDLFYKSDIVTTLEKLDKFETDGELKPKTTVYDGQLRAELKRVKEAVMKVYGDCKRQGIQLDSTIFTELVDKELHPERAERPEDRTLLGQLRQFYRQYQEKSPLVFRDYQVLHGKLERFLRIKKREDALPSEFTGKDLMAFYDFNIEEFKYAQDPRFGKYYVGMPTRNIPVKKRSQNTVATEIKKLRTFFKYHAANDDGFGKTPFERLTDEQRRRITSEEYDDAVFLTKDEFLKVLNADVPDSLRETRDVFVLQCNFGARIEDFRKMSMEYVTVQDETGIPYYRYTPHKTLRKSKKDIETPILRYALDIIKRYRFQFPILKYVTGHNGYNAKIKDLLKHCGIDRGCKVWNEDKKANDLIPIHEIASSKLCRKTFVDMMVKVQIDKYAAGVHKKGSEAVNHYTNMGLADRFKLMCAAFDQPLYRVDNSLNVIEQQADEVEEWQREAEELKARIAERTATMPTTDDLKAWAQAMAELAAYNHELNEINARIIEELRK